MGIPSYSGKNVRDLLGFATSSVREREEGRGAPRMMTSSMLMRMTWPLCARRGEHTQEARGSRKVKTHSVSSRKLLFNERTNNKREEHLKRKRRKRA